MRTAVLARCMKPQRETAEEIGPAKDPTSRRISQRNSAYWNKAAIRAANGYHASQQLCIGHVWIVVWHCIAAREEGNAAFA
jgi:hypothetical protein